MHYVPGFDLPGLKTTAQPLLSCFYNRLAIASRRTESGSFTRLNLSQLGASRNTPQYLEWGCSSAGEHFPRTEGVGRSNRLSSTILIKTEYLQMQSPGHMSWDFLFILRCSSIFKYPKENPIFLSAKRRIVKCDDLTLIFEHLCIVHKHESPILC